MNICFIIEHFVPHIGGAEIAFYEYSNELTKKGHHVRVVTSASGGVYGKTVENKVEVFHHDWSTFFGHPIPKRKDIIKHILWADVVHTTTYTAALPTVSACRKLKKPCVITVHEALRYRWYIIEPNPVIATLYWIFERYVITRKYDFWHAVSDNTKEDLLQISIPEDRIRRIYHGIDQKFWHNNVEPLDLHALFNFNKDDKIFLFFGRPGQSKGLFVLFEAIKKVAKKIPKHVKFAFILSHDPLKQRNNFLNLVEQNHFNDLVRITGSVDQDRLRGYIKAAYCVIIPSITEGFGFSAVETCSLDIPIISSDAGSLNEVVFGNHLFFKNRDSRDLADKILMAINGQFDSIDKKEFSWDKSTNKMLELYETINHN